MRYLLCCIVPGLLGILSPSTLNAQPPLSHGGEFGAPVLPTVVYYEAINLASETPGHSRLDILYRLDLSFFVAVRADRQQTKPFKQEGDILVELLDSSGHSVARDTERFLEQCEVSEIKPFSRWHEGMFSFDVLPASYTIAVTIEDHESDRLFSEKRVRTIAKDFPADGETVSVPFFVSPLPDPVDSTAILAPLNGGGGLFFGEEAALVVQVTNPPPVAPTVQWSCSVHDKQDQTPVSVLSGVDDDPLVLSHSRLVPSGKHPPVYDIAPSDQNYSLFVVRLQAEKLRLRPHELTITFIYGTDTTRSSLDFNVIWPAIPRSLRNPDYALDVLRYITTDDELDSLSSGPQDERKRHLDEFWAARDRTPETAFNEVMNEYYSRVDYATTTFKTLRTPDGSFTDRGRIYILYGAPTKTERKLDPSGFMETWSYQSAGKKFIFLDESKNGNYILTSTQPL